MRVAIVDDEPLARDLLGRLVRDRADLQLVGEASNGTDAVDLLERERPDVVLLDVEIPAPDGFAVLTELEGRQIELPRVIFVTAYDRYAVRAFEAQALDYLLKPVTPDRFAQAIARCGADRARPSTNVSLLAEDALHRPPRRVLVRRRGRITPIAVADIDWIEASGDYVTIHVGDQKHLLERTLSDMERLLAPSLFLRIHRGALVNQSRIRELQSLGSGRYRLTLQTGQSLVVSRTYSGQFRDGLL